MKMKNKPNKKLKRNNSFKNEISNKKIKLDLKKNNQEK